MTNAEYAQLKINVLVDLLKSELDELLRRASLNEMPDAPPSENRGLVGYQQGLREARKAVDRCVRIDEKVREVFHVEHPVTSDNHRL